MRGVTLIELLIVISILVGACLGSAVGQHYGAQHDLSTTGAIVGAVLGALAVLATLLSLVVLVMGISAMRRWLRPLQRVCTCGRGEGPSLLGPSAKDLVSALIPPEGEAGSAVDERKALVARLDAEPLGTVLESGHVPPRLALAFALGVSARAVETFEFEFHESRLAREQWDTARAAFERRSAPVGSPHWAAEPGGCRVVKQSKRDYVLGKQTPAQHMLFALLRLRRLPAVTFEARDLWVNYAEASSSDAYDSAALRLQSNKPAHLAAALAGELVKHLGPDELVWQRDFLKTLITRWASWDEDRADYTQRVEAWAVRVREELRTDHFDVAAFANSLSAELAPWSVRR